MLLRGARLALPDLLNKPFPASNPGSIMLLPTGAILDFFEEQKGERNREGERERGTMRRVATCVRCESLERASHLVLRVQSELREEPKWGLRRAQQAIVLDSIRAAPSSLPSDPVFQISVSHSSCH